MGASASEGPFPNDALTRSVLDAVAADPSALVYQHVITAWPDPATAAVGLGGQGVPGLRVISAVVRQHRTTRPRDLPLGEESLAVRWPKKQYTGLPVGCAALRVPGRDRCR